MRFINNIGENNLKKVLLEESHKYKHITIVSPFLSRTDVLFNLLQNFNSVKLITRLAHPATPELFEDLLKFNNLHTYVYDDDSLHSKIYLLQSENSSLVIIGSSNMTNGGLLNNKEFNIVLDNTDTQEILSYISFLENNSFEELNKETVSYYKSFYRKPVIVNRFRKLALNMQIVNNYNEYLSKYLTIKGILESYNTSKLPFTYLFDAFDQQYKTKILHDYQLNNEKIDKVELIKYFKIFLSQYFSKDDESWRYKKYLTNMDFVKNFSSINDDKVIDFIMSLHCVNTGSGCGVRKKELPNSKPSQIRKIISFILYDNIEMAQKVSIILSKKENGGMKVRYLGPSAIQEIPGWLLPGDYPILNSKFEFVLNCFNI